MARFWDVNKGSVKLGGIDVKDYSLDSLMSNFSMVFQNVYLFNDSIENNIKFGKPAASHEEVVAAAKAARCHDFIMALPDGYDTVIGEGGATISGGERQRLSIARAMLKDAPIVILDEATANVDPENEAELQAAIEALTGGKTIIMIAHRLKTVRHANQILVVDHGRIVQHGTHDQLIQQKGIYADFSLNRKAAIVQGGGGVSTKRFLLQKILQLFLTLFLVTAITFILMQLSPIDAAEAYSRRIFTVDETRIEAVREQMGLNRPIVVQYLDWLNDLLHFDLGNSYVDNRDVFLIVGSALKETACIVLLSAVLQAVGALVLGVLLYLTRKNVIGKILAFVSIAAISIPAFYLATSFIDVVAVRWNLISVSGNTGLMRYLPAALCLAVGGIAFFGQMLSKAIQQAMSEDSVLYSRCRGLSDPYIVVRYAMPQTIISTVPTFMQMMGMCMAGSAIVENIFSLPGLGYRIVNSLTNRDLPVIYATVLFLAFALVIFNILADIIQRLLQTRKGGL